MNITELGLVTFISGRYLLQINDFA